MLFLANHDIITLFLQVAFSSNPHRVTSHGYPHGQEACHVQCINDVASTMNKMLMTLVASISNVHYIGHPRFGYADVQAFEESLIKEGKDHAQRTQML